jgi:hypothetical protein
MKPFRIHKFANAFFPSGHLNARVPSVAASGIKVAEKGLGGLWVGGSVEMTDHGVQFQANAMNRALHHGETSVTIPTQAIRNVRREFGFLTGIVVIEHDAGEFRFRCFGAKGVIANYQAATASSDA